MEKQKIKIALVNGKLATEAEYQWTLEQIESIKDFMRQLILHESRKASRDQMNIWIKED